MKHSKRLITVLSSVTAIALLAVTVITTAPAQAQSTTATNTTTTTVPTKKIYAALGDSIAAGLGLNAKANPVGNDTRCGRSSQAYGYTVAKAAKLPILLVPCSGATVGDLLTKQAVAGPNVEAQLDRAYRAGDVRLITITAGANDVHWADYIKGCYAYNCATPSASFVADGLRLVMKVKLYAALSDISYRSQGNPPTVILTGYYNPVSAACANLQTNVTPEEISWIGNQTAALNQAIQDVASHYSFVRFAPVDFTGHDICAANSWIQGPTAAAPFHPTATGQQAIAKSVISALNR